MTNKETQYPLLKFTGSVSLLLTITGVLLAIGGQLDFLGNERKQPHENSAHQAINATDSEKPKYSFYDELKKRKTELEQESNNSTDIDGHEEKKLSSDEHDYVVQVGAFSKQIDADRLKKIVENLGYPARVIKSQNNKFLAQAGPFKGKKHAAKIESRLKNQRLDTLLKRLK